MKSLNYRYATLSILKEDMDILMPILVYNKRRLQREYPISLDNLVMAYIEIPEIMSGCHNVGH